MSVKSLAPAIAIALLAGACSNSAAEPAQESAAIQLSAQQAQWPAQCAEDAGWHDPGPPFPIFGNSYYVGTCGIGAILITGEDGHILIDSGTDKGAEVVEANIRALGFDPADVKILLFTHEHSDHAGGMARLKKLTGARLLAPPRAVAAMTAGKPSTEDPQFGLGDSFPPATIDSRIANGEPVTLGKLSVTPVFTPGHTPGATSWQWQACEGEMCRTIVYADSLSAISDDTYRFSDHPAYVADFRKGIARLSEIDCDILLTPHPSASDMHGRLSAKGLVDEAACKAYGTLRRQQLDERLQKETHG